MMVIFRIMLVIMVIWDFFWMFINLGWFEGGVRMVVGGRVVKEMRKWLNREIKIIYLLKVVRL